MLVRLNICVEIASKFCKFEELRPLGVALFVILVREVSVSFGVGMFCNASIVADGGVFSPKMAFGGGLRRLGVSLPLGVGVAVPERVGLLSGETFSKSKLCARGSRSGDRSGDLVGDLSRDPSTST